MFDETKEKLGIWAADKIQGERDRKGLIRTFLFGLAGNIIVWIVAFFAPVFLGDAVGFAIELEGRVMMYLSIIPFIFGFVMMYAICKLRPLKIKRPEDAKGEFMTGYLEHTHRDHTRLIFLLSAMCGATNAILLVAAIIWFR